MLPQRVFCEGCGATLYEGLELESPLEVIQRHGGVCPRCNKKLNFNSENIRIVPFSQE